MGGGDLDQDGRIDLVLYNGEALQIWHNDPDGEWGVEEVSKLFPDQVADLDGDGDVDIRGREWRSEGEFTFSYISKLLLNDGKGNFTLTTPEPPGEGYLIIGMVQPARKDRKAILWWGPSTVENRSLPRLSTYQDGEGQEVHEVLPPTELLLTLKASDWNLDGYTDLVTADKFTSTEYPTTTYGLNFLLNQGDGRVDTVSTFKDLALDRGGVQFFEVDEDGVLDAVVVHNTVRDPAVIVLAGQRDGRFVLAGRYPLTQGRGLNALGGDLDRDGDVDLVVFDSSAPESAGIHVLLNQTSDQFTAVGGGIVSLPAQHRLGTAYPNPFNPGVVIPFTVGTSGAPVTLTIYNTLGQQVRKLELGELPTGAHQVVWDGLGESGKVLSSGVYLYRLQVGAWSASGKMVKSK